MRQMGRGRLQRGMFYSICMGKDPWGVRREMFMEMASNSNQEREPQEKIWEELGWVVRGNEISHMLDYYSQVKVVWSLF